MSIQPDQLAGILVGLAVVSIATGLALRAERTRAEARLRAFVLGPDSAISEELAAPRRAGSRSAGLGRLWARVPGSSMLGARPRDLAQAGLSLTPGQFLARQALAGLAGLVLARLVGGRLGFEGAVLVAAMLVGGIVGLWLSRLVLGFLRQRRLRRFEAQFSNGVDALASALQAGLSLPQALDMLGREMPDPLGPEIAQVIRGLNMGLSLDEALAGLLDRVPSTDVDIFVTAVQIQYRIGGNLSAILRTIALTVRERMRIRGEVRVLTAQQRLAGYIISGAPVFIGCALFFINPTYMGRLFEPGIGRVMLIMAIVSGTIGFFVIRRITNIQV